MRNEGSQAGASSACSRSRWIAMESGRFAERKGKRGRNGVADISTTIRVSKLADDSAVGRKVKEAEQEQRQ